MQDQAGTIISNFYAGIRVRREGGFEGFLKRAFEEPGLLEAAAELSMN